MVNKTEFLFHIDVQNVIICVSYDLQDTYIHVFYFNTRVFSSPDRQLALSAVSDCHISHCMLLRVDDAILVRCQGDGMFYGFADKASRRVADAMSISPYVDIDMC